VELKSERWLRNFCSAACQSSLRKSVTHTFVRVPTETATRLIFPCGALRTDVPTSNSVSLPNLDEVKTLLLIPEDLDARELLCSTIRLRP